MTQTVDSSIPMTQSTNRRIATRIDALIKESPIASIAESLAQSRHVSVDGRVARWALRGINRRDSLRDSSGDQLASLLIRRPIRFFFDWRIGGWQRPGRRAKNGISGRGVKMGKTAKLVGAQKRCPRWGIVHYSALFIIADRPAW